MPDTTPNPSVPLAPDLADRMRARLARTPVARHLGLRLLAVSPGAAEILLPLREDLTNDAGVIQGGILAALADAAIAFALATAFDGKMGFATSDLTIHYLRRAKGDVLARARIVRRGGTVATGEADLVDAKDGRHLCRVLSSFVLTTSRASRPVAPPAVDAPPAPPAAGRARGVRRPPRTPAAATTPKKRKRT